MRTHISAFVIIFLVLLAACQPTMPVHEQEDSEGNQILETYESLSPQAKALYYKQSEGLTKAVPARMVELDEKRIGCFGPSSIMQMQTSEGNLGGQCCGALTNFEAYELQLQALNQFIEENGNLDFIPRDPYDIAVQEAQRLTAWDSEISLSAEQQATYNQAIDLSHHGGPCCCKCWKWYTMSGLAKKLIVDHGWDEHQIAELWDISSSCGHDDDTNMVQHYIPHSEDHPHK